MNSLLAGMQQIPTARTANGDAAHATTWNSNLDLFGRAGSLRRDQAAVLKLFKAALAEDEEVAIRVALWVRDVRGGAGERETFRTILRFLGDARPEVAQQVAVKVAEVGRWDDLLVLLGTKAEESALREIAQGLYSGNGLCAKWMPRKGQVAVKLRSAFGMSPKQYRKLLVSLTNVVETQMCAKEWENIDFGKLPSLAAARYQKAFERNAGTQYQKYVTALEKGEAKINASAIFPHDVVQAAFNGNDTVATAQWEQLPNYFDVDHQERVLPMVDVSGSMVTPINGGRFGGSGVTCMQAAIALGIYCAERNVGAFKDYFMTFTSRPTLQRIPTGVSLQSRVKSITGHVGYDTNFDRAYRMILDTAICRKVPQEEMPTMLLVLSDMQFNQGYSYVHTATAHERLTKAFADAGYEIPKLVYWNLNASYGNNPITIHDSGAAVVSGFSPALLKPVLGAKQFDPYAVMMEAVMSDRYNWKQQ